MRQGRPTTPTEERPAGAVPVEIEDYREDHERDPGFGHGFSPKAEDSGGFGPAEEWMILADRRMERLEAKIDRLNEAVDQFNGQLHTLLTVMPTRSGINLYLVGGLIGGLAVGLAIMGITIGGFVGGLTSLRPEPAPLAGPSYAPQPQAPIIIQMPAGSMPSGTVATPLAPMPSPLPPLPASGGH